MPSHSSRDRVRDASAIVGERVRRRRESLGLTQEQLAHRSGLSRNRVQNLEKNRNNSRDAIGRLGPANPRLDTLWAIAATLETTVSELLDGIDAR